MLETADGGTRLKVCARGCFIPWKLVHLSRCLILGDTRCGCPACCAAADT